MQASLTLLTILSCASAVELQQFSQDQAVAESAANPIRRVVTMLQGMTKKIESEAKKEEELYDKYMCYCKSAGGTLQGGIDAANNKIPQVESSLKEAISSKAQLEQDVKSQQAARAEAKSSMAAATNLRDKELAAFSKEKAASDANIDALGGAIAAIEKGMTGFLQTSTAQMLKRLAMASDLSNFDRQMVMAFLSGKQTDGYVPQSGQITGILKQMQDTMVKDRDELVATEKASVASFNELMSAKTKEVGQQTKAIESKSKRVGALGVEIAEMKIDLEDTQTALAEDTKFLKDMDSTCAAKTAEWGRITKARGQELVAIADTIKILNDDDALELFKKTNLKSPSFVQEVTNSVNLKNKALGMVQEIRARSPRSANRMPLDLISMALSGKKVNFEKVVKLIDNMIGILGQEQVDDDSKKAYCEKQFDASDDKKKGLQQDLKDLEATIEDSTEAIATLTDEIKALSKGIKDLDADVAESTETRKEEHEEFTELMASDNAAKELIGLAKNRLNKYYNPKEYQAPAKAEAALVEVHEHRANIKDAPAPPPESFNAYSAKSDDSGSVVKMLDTLVADLDKEMTEADTAEKAAQKEYEAFMGDAAEKRADDSKSVTDKEGYKAGAETELEAAKEGKTAKVREMMATEKYISGLHASCDWLMSNFDVRKEARAGEIDALKNAKAVLAGADFALVQQGHTVARALRGRN